MGKAIYLDIRHITLRGILSRRRDKAFCSCTSGIHACHGQTFAFHCHIAEVRANYRAQARHTLCAGVVGAFLLARNSQAYGYSSHAVSRWTYTYPYGSSITM